MLYATSRPARDADATASPGVVGFYKTTDGGEHWRSVENRRRATRRTDPRPLARIGGGDLPTVTVDPKNENVVYSASVVMWRTEDGGNTWTAVRGAPGGDDYQSIWINPNNPNIILAVADQGGVVSANRGVSWSNWYKQPTAAMYHVTDRQRLPVPRLRRAAGLRLGVRRQPLDGRTDHLPRLASGQHPGVRHRRARPEGSRHRLRQRAQQRLALRSRAPAQTTQRRARHDARGPNGESYNRNVRTMPLHWSPVDPDALYYASNAVWKTHRPRHSLDAHQPRPRAADVGRAGERRQVREQRDARPARQPSPRSRRRRATSNVLWAGTDDGNIQVTTDGGATWTNVTPPSIKPWTRIFNIEAGHFDDAHRLRRREHAARSTTSTRISGARTTAARPGRRSTPASRRGAVANSIREDPRVQGLLYAAPTRRSGSRIDDGDHWQSLRLNMPAISVRDIQRQGRHDLPAAPISSPARTAAASGSSTTSRRSGRRRRSGARRERRGRATSSSPATAVRVRFATNDPTPLAAGSAGRREPAAGRVARLLPRRATRRGP